MRANFLMMALLPFTLVACDSDGDGLSNAEEAELGTDPKLPDTDGDGITDFDEVQGSTDPLAADSDDDGFEDGRELYSDSTDPNDPMSYVRTTDGEWPDLSGYADAGTSEGWAIGDRFKNYTFVDQYGEEVELYQFWGNVVLVDFSAGWCPPCRAVAENAEAEYRAHADDGFVIVHMMIDDNQNGGGIDDPDFLDSWASQYGLTFPVVDFSDGWEESRAGLSSSGLYQGGIPFMILLDQNMEIVQAETGSGSEGRLIATAEALLGE